MLRRVLPSLIASASLWSAPQVRPQAGDLARAQEDFAAARYAEAEKTLAAASAKAPDDALVWNLLGQARYALKHWDAAVDAFERASSLMPDDVRVLVNLGVCEFSRQNLERAERALRRAANLDPSQSRAHLFLARIAVARGEAERAESEFELAVTCPRPEPLACFYQGLHFFQQRRLDEAETAFERAVQLMPDHPGAYMNLGLVLDRKGEKDKARGYFERFRDMTDLKIADADLKLKLMGLIKSAERDIEDANPQAALASALEAVRLAPDAPNPHRLLGRVYGLLGRSDEAKAEAAKAQALYEKANAK